MRGPFAGAGLWVSGLKPAVQWFRPADER